MLAKLARHMSNYSLGGLLVTLSGFISFPIFTRMFSVEEYGIMNLISATLLLLVGLAKLGIQHAALRFYSEINAGKREETLPKFYATVVYGMAGTGLLAAVVWAGLIQVVPSTWWSDGRIVGLLLLTSALIFLRTVDSGLLNILRAEHRSGIFSLYTVLKRYGALALILTTVFFLLPGLNGFYVATITAEALAVAILATLTIRRTHLARAGFSTPLYRAMLVFGLPMVAYEVGGVLLSFGDRYVIQTMLDAKELGTYSAAYNMCEYVQAVTFTAFGQAMIPMFLSAWEDKGEQAARAFIDRALHFYLLIGVAIVAGVAAVGEDLLVFLASEKYRDGAAIVPFVIAGMLADNAFTLLGAGLFIHKRTKVMTVLVIGCATLNLVLNVILVPQIGIMGSAVSTLISYTVLTVAARVYCARLLPITFPFGQAIKFSLFGLCMYAAVINVHIEPMALGLVAKVAVGALVYGVLVLIGDQISRDGVRSALGKLRRA